MAKLYDKKGILRGEELSETVPLKEWTKNAFEINEEPNTIFKFLFEFGRYFTNHLDAPPEGIIHPRKIRKYQCHYNNVFYGLALKEEQPEVLSDFTFVSGFYGMKAIHECVPSDKKYFIANHSFMTYKGAVLDYTVLEYPPNAYKPDQYFGIAFDVTIMLNAFDEFFQKNNNIIPGIPILEVLYNQPYLKE